jgi:hypothetical protein
MAYPSDDDGAANNGFGRRSFHQWEGRLLHAAGYMAPPDFWAPRGCRLSAGGIPIPPPPTGAALDTAIDEVIETMSDEQHADPRFYPDYREAWTTFFRRRYERELAAYDGPPPPPARNNAAGRRRWWSAPGRTLEFVLQHIENGNDPVLEMPPAPRPMLSRRRGSSWMPCQMAFGSSGTASSGSATRSGSLSSASTPRTVKMEPVTVPRRNSGALVIREGGARTTSPPRRRKATKKDATHKAVSELTVAEARRAEEAATEEAIRRSLRDVIPAENTMPLDAALEWSRREWEREEREQRRLLDLAAAQRRVAAATLSRRGAPPVVKLEESSDDELYRPTPPRFGDAGQGSSRQAPPPQDDDSSDDDGGDYTTQMYSRFGM